jgi:hypothetical protein
MGAGYNSTGSFLHIGDALRRLSAKNYIDTIPNAPMFGHRANGSLQNTLDGHTNFAVVLRPEGHEYISNLLKQEKQIMLLERQTESIEATNEANSKLSAATTTFYEITQPEFTAW